MRTEEVACSCRKRCNPTRAGAGEHGRGPGPGSFAFQALPPAARMRIGPRGGDPPSEGFEGSGARSCPAAKTRFPAQKNSRAWSQRRPSGAFSHCFCRSGSCSSPSGRPANDARTAHGGSSTGARTQETQSRRGALSPATKACPGYCKREGACSTRRLCQPATCACCMNSDRGACALLQRPLPRSRRGNCSRDRSRQR